MVGGGGVCKLTESDSKWPENVIFFVGLSVFFTRKVNINE